MSSLHAFIRELKSTVVSAPLALPLALLCMFMPLRAQQVATLNGSGANAKPAAPAEAPRQKRIAPLRTSETPDTTRITITADAALDDYSAYRTGDSFFILLPHMNVAAAQ